MGKNQHSKDQLHIRPTEWKQDHGGCKDKKRSPFAQLPLHCCFLSLQPFEQPVGTKDGAIFEVKNIIQYIKRFGVNPITGGKLEVSELMPLHFHRNAEGTIQCPVTYKEFTNHSHVVLNTVSGHVYSFDAVDQLNRKVKNWKDLTTSQPFKWVDIISIQNADEPAMREVSKFWYVENGQQEEVTAMIIDRDRKPEEKEGKEAKINMSASMARIYEEKQRLADEKAKEEGPKASDEQKATGKTGSAYYSAELALKQRKTNERYTDGKVAESFTSTAGPLRYKNDLRALTEEEELEEIYTAVRKKKAKGYVRITTSEGMLNVELHTDIVPRTTDNFLRLCDKDYFDGTVWHRLVQNFMLQGGDPTGTGRGGESAWEGGKAFRDEIDSRLSHQGPGILSMANSGKNQNRSQFFVTMKSCQHLDGKHSIFGRVVGGLQLLTVFNGWETDEKDRPTKEIKLIRTEVFKNPFREAAIEAAKKEEKQVEKVVDPVATWFSNRKDPMEDHKNRTSNVVGKYLTEALQPLPGEKRKAEELPAEEMEYAAIPHKPKKVRTSFDFSKVL